MVSQDCATSSCVLYAGFHKTVAYRGKELSKNNGRHKLSILTNIALKSRIYCNSRHKASGVHISEVVAIFSFLERKG